MLVVLAKQHRIPKYQWSFHSYRQTSYWPSTFMWSMEEGGAYGTHDMCILSKLQIGTSLYHLPILNVLWVDLMTFTCIFLKPLKTIKVSHCYLPSVTKVSTPRKGRVVPIQWPFVLWALGHWRDEQTLYSRQPPLKRRQVFISIICSYLSFTLHAKWWTHTITNTRRYVLVWKWIATIRLKVLVL